MITITLAMMRLSTSELDGLRVDHEVGQLLGDVGFLLLVALGRRITGVTVAARQPVAAARRHRHVAVYPGRDRCAAAGQHQRRRRVGRSVDTARSGTEFSRPLTANTRHSISRRSIGYSRRYSMTQVLLELNVVSFDTLTANNCFRFTQQWQLCDNKMVNPLMGKGNYSAISNNMKLVHWPLMGGLLHLVQR